MSIKKFAGFTGIVFIGLVLFLGVVIAGVGMYFNISKKSEHTIKMTGTAQVNVKPDVVKIQLRIDALEKNVKTARQVSGKKYDGVVKVLTSEFKVPSTNIEIIDNSISEDWIYDSKENTITKSRATKAFQVTFNDFDKAEQFYQKAVDQYGCQIDSVDYDSTKLREYKDMARKNAVTAAKEKAVNMVKDLGQNVGKAINIQGNDDSQDSYYWNNSTSNSYVNNSNSGNAKSKSLNSNLDISYTAVVTFELD